MSQYIIKDKFVTEIEDLEGKKRRHGPYGYRLNYNAGFDHFVFGEYENGKRVGVWRRYLSHTGYNKWAKAKGVIEYATQVDHDAGVITTYGEYKSGPPLPGVPPGGVVRLVKLNKEEIKKQIGGKEKIGVLKHTRIRILCKRAGDCSEAYFICDSTFIHLNCMMYGDGSNKVKAASIRSNRHYKVYKKEGDWCLIEDGWIFCKDLFVGNFTVEDVKNISCPKDYYEPAFEKGLLCCRPKTSKTCFNAVKWDSRMFQYSNRSSRYGNTWYGNTWSQVTTSVDGQLHGPYISLDEVGETHKTGGLLRQVHKGVWRYYKPIWDKKKKRLRQVFLAQVDFEKGTIVYGEKNKPWPIGVPETGIVKVLSSFQIRKIALEKKLTRKEREHDELHNPMGVLNILEMSVRMTCTKLGDCSEVYDVSGPWGRRLYDNRTPKGSQFVVSNLDYNFTRNFLIVSERKGDWCEILRGPVVHNKGKPYYVSSWRYCKKGFYTPIGYINKRIKNPGRNEEYLRPLELSSIYEKPSGGPIDRARLLIPIDKEWTEDLEIYKAYMNFHLQLTSTKESRVVKGRLWIKGTFGVFSSLKHVKGNIYRLNEDVYIKGKDGKKIMVDFAVGDVLLKQKPVWFPFDEIFLGKSGE